MQKKTLYVEKKNKKRIYRTSRIPAWVQIFLMRLPISAVKLRIDVKFVLFFAQSFLFLFNKNAGSCCCLINLQPACLSSLFFVKYELACVRLR